MNLPVVHTRFALLLTLLPLAGCPAKEGGTPPDADDTGTWSSMDDTGPGSSPSDDTADTGSGGGTDTGSTWTFGLDERPDNPTCMAPERPASVGDVSLVAAFPELTFQQPVAMLQAPGDDSRWFVVEQTGRVKVFENAPDAWSSSNYIDLSGVVGVASELGLLGMAFHPDFDTNHQVFLYYTLWGGSGWVSRLSRFTTNVDGTALSRSSETIILEIDQPYANHNGGTIVFGPDGYLYWGMGDGGWAGDPWGHGQNTDTLLGGILRIDVDGGSPYAIPPDNPFAAGGGAPELYAWGLRNPWQITFDAATGELWAGDVGQYTWEEIDRVERGGNYGWNLREGAHCYLVTPCDIGGLIDPVIEYLNPEDASVVVGHVYRGSVMPTLDGVLIYTDFYTGEIWGLDYDETTGEPGPMLLGEVPGAFFSTFGQDIDGEVYAVEYLTGTIYRMESAGDVVASTFPEQLSSTGCVDPDAPSQPVDGMIPYGVRQPLWSDGASKDRWLALPDGSTITVGTDGDWELPIGSVLLKQFRLGDALLETRLFVRHDDGEWGGYTYTWDADGTDATYARGGGSSAAVDPPWVAPSSAQCLQCHTASAGRTLGLETGQLNRMFTYPGGRSADQLETLDHIGLFSEPLLSEGETSASLPVLPERGGLEPVDQEARAYLHVNCSTCHRPEGTGGGDMDLRYRTPFPEMRVCNEAPTAGDMGITDASLIRPGAPHESLIALRMATLDAPRMPGVGSDVVDDEGVDLIEAWITEMSDCEDGR